MLDPGKIIRKFGSEVSKILKKYLIDYDIQVCFVDNSTRAYAKEDLKDSFSMEILKTYIIMARYIGDEVVAEFKNNFDVAIEEIKFDPLILRDEVFNSILIHVAAVGKGTEVMAGIFGNKTAETSSSDQTIP